MKKLVFSFVLLLSVTNIQAQNISLNTFGAASVGEILAVSGYTFTIRQRVCIYMGQKR